MQWYRGATLRQHLKVTFGHTHESHRENERSIWNIQVGRCHRVPMEFRSELQLAAHQIYQQAKAPVTLYLDGSFSSQVMLNAFFWARIPLRVIIPRFRENLAAFGHAILAADNLGVAYEVFDFELEEFIQSDEALKWGKLYQTDRLDQVVAMATWKSRPKEFMVFPFGLSCPSNPRTKSAEV